MAQPFTPMRVTRFILLWLLAMLAVYGLFLLLTHARARQSITPSKVSLLLNGIHPVAPENQGRSGLAPLVRPA